MGNVFVFSLGDSDRPGLCVADEKGRDLDSVLKVIGSEVPAEILRHIYPDGRCWVWAGPDRGENRSTWSLMCEGDLVLAYRSGAIIAASYVRMTLESPSAAEFLLDAGGEGPLRLLCFCGKPFMGEVTIVPQMERYLDRDFTGFTRLRQEKCENILNDYGSVEVFVRLGLRYDFPFSFRHSE